MIITLPIPGFLSVIRPAVFGLPGDGTEFSPGVSVKIVQLSLFLFGKLFVGDVLFHAFASFSVSILSVSPKKVK